MKKRLGLFTVLGFSVPVVTLVLSALSPRQSSAQELIETYRSTRQMAMGGAYTALADDESALFLNPAGLAGQKLSLFHLAVSDTAVSTDVYSSFKDVMKAFGGGISGSTLNVLMGKDIHVRETFTPTIQVGSFAIAGYLDQKVDMLAKNQSLPNIDFGFQTTYGVQAGYGFSIPIGGGRKKKKDGTGGSRHELKLGVAGKLLWRQGGMRQLPTATLLNLSQSAIMSVVGPKSSGYGFDFGSLYTFRINPKFKLMSSMVLTDIGDTTFSGGPDAIPMNFVIGTGAQYQLGSVRLSTLYDIRHVGQDVDPRKRHNVGLEIAMPVLAVYGGLHQSHLTYGASFDLWVFRITAATYTEEIGTLVGQDAERRWLLKAGVKLLL